MTTTQSRKADHIRICLEGDVQCDQVTTGLERYRFSHSGLPEIDRDGISLQTSFLGKSLQAPILVSSMTGGTDQARQINRILAEAAQAWGLAMGVGSQRVAIEQPDLANTFQVRSIAPDILLLANLGAVQLNYACGIDDCRRLVEDLEADALILHLNPLQECIQPDGDTKFAGLLAKIEQLCAQLSVPVVVKEVGNGISGALAQRLAAVGVAAIDVAGAGGTSWAKVERDRAQTTFQRQLGESFANWGIPTADCLVQVRRLLPEVPLIASGGLQSGIDVAKALALGANLAGLARPLLQAACESPECLGDRLDLLLAELTTVMFCTGCGTVAELARSGLLERLE